MYNKENNILEINEEKNELFLTPITYGIIIRCKLETANKISFLLKNSEDSSIIFEKMAPPFTKLWIVEKEEE